MDNKLNTKYKTAKDVTLAIKLAEKSEWRGRHVEDATRQEIVNGVLKFFPYVILPKGNLGHKFCWCIFDAILE
jgi:hypothetical protein